MGLPIPRDRYIFPVILALALIAGSAARAGAQAVSAPPPPDPAEEKPHWTGDIMGAPLLMWQFGVTDQTMFSLNGSIALIEPKASYSFDGDYGYTKVKAEGFEQTVVDAQHLSFTARRELTKRTYLTVRPAFKRNKIQGVDYQMEELAGYGIIVTESARGTLHVVPIAGVLQQQKNVASVDGNSGTAGVLQIASFKLGPMWRWNESFLVMQNFKDSSDYRTQFSTELQGKIIGPVTMQIKFSHERDNIVALGDNQAVRTLVLGIGVSFK
jgi:hypothetical protein